MQDSRDVDSEAMSVIGNYKGSSTKQKNSDRPIEGNYLLKSWRAACQLFFLQVLGQHPLHYQIMRLSNS